MSFFADFGRRVIEARTREARRHVNAVLLNMDDKTLCELGYDRAELRRNAASRVF